MAVCPWVAMCAELVTPSCRALVTLARRCEAVWPMDWICPALCDCVCATERRSRRSSESWDSSAELFLWPCAICRASQRTTMAKTTAAMSTAEFIDYYFTRTKKNSPPTWVAEKGKGLLRARESWVGEGVEKKPHLASVWYGMNLIEP